VTVHRNKFLYNKTNQMHQFPKFTPASNSTCFGQFLFLSSGVYSLYTRHRYMSYRFVDSFRAGPGCSILILLEKHCTAVATDLGHPYWIYIIPTHSMHQWLLLQFLVLLMMNVEIVPNM